MIWTLNRMENYFATAQSRREVAALFLRKGWKDVVFGDRHEFENDPVGLKAQKYESEKDYRPGEEYIPFALMNEFGEKNEYYVPIPVKCLGKRFTDPRCRHLRDEFVKRKNPERPSEKTVFKSYWGLRRNAYITEKNSMNTRPTTGYYEILGHLTATRGCKHLLIAYSQGGLVARYLAYLDEYVFKEDLIEGVVTVESPNFGSPLANPVMKESAIDGVLSAVNTLFGSSEALIGVQKEALDFHHVTEALSAVRQTESFSKMPFYFVRFIETAEKWLSGLRGTVGSAFFDQNIYRLGIAGSVLNSVNGFLPRRIQYGALVGCGTRMDGFLDAFIRFPFKKLAPMTKIALIAVGLGLTTAVCFSSLALLFGIFSWNSTALFPVAGSLATLLFAFAAWRKDDLARFLVKRVLNRTNIRKSELIYKELVMRNEPPEGLTPHPLAEVIEDLHAQGLKFRSGHKLRKRDHDFVIPSAYQLSFVLDGGRPSFERQGRFLGNLINSTANHESGKSPVFPDGKRQERLLFQLLERFGPARPT